MTLLALLYALTLLLLLGGVWKLWQRPPDAILTRTLPAQGFAGGTLPLGVHLRLRARLPTRVVLEDPAPLTVVPAAQLRSPRHDLSPRVLPGGASRHRTAPRWRWHRHVEH